MGDPRRIDYNATILAQEYRPRERRIGWTQIGVDVTVGAYCTIMLGSGDGQW